MSTHAEQHYFVPHSTSWWPIVGTIALGLVAWGGAITLNDKGWGVPVFWLGLALFIFMLFGWFATVVHESVTGQYKKQEDLSFRWGMSSFILSEVFFFAVFFLALFYARNYVMSWLSGESIGFFTHSELWSSFSVNWPLSTIPDTEKYSAYSGVIGAWGIPAINTLLLLSSGVTLTLAHWQLKANKRTGLAVWLFATIVLGSIFMVLQASEYAHAYHELGLTLNSGIYGSTFFMLTGFHGLHVTVGLIMLMVIWLRTLKGHFSSHHHFGFEAVAWYWHFVDVVWLLLFVMVYWL